MLSLETEIQILSNCYDFFSKIVSQEILLQDLPKKEMGVYEEKLEIENLESSNLLPIVFKISKTTLPE